MLKTIGCGELRSADAGKDVTLAGWVHRRRDHGGLIFIDLRDRSGIVQVVLNPKESPEAHETGTQFRNEWVVQVEGRVGARPAGTENPDLGTGEIEVGATSVEVLNPSRTPPFYVNEEVEVEESLRLKHRYVDLRRQRLQRNIALRHRVVKYIRDFLDGEGFLEIETPVLIKSTPEGARDYLVPSRVHPGSFYALPQSPQQLKQLLMVSGFERYFQIARCFRDEDQRADRQPEFTQLDLEMSFVDDEDVLDLTEALFTGLVESVTPEMGFTKPFPRISYDDAMRRFGTDKPDLRFGLELEEITEVVKGSGFKVFRSVADGDGTIKGMRAPGCSGYSRRQLDELTEFARERGAKGLVTIALQGEPDSEGRWSGEQVKSAVTRFLSEDDLNGIIDGLGAEQGDLLLIVAGDEKTTNAALSALRNEMGQRLGLADSEELSFLFVVDFPLVDWNEDEGRWDSTHHPFTSPRQEDIGLMDSDPGRVRARCYDMVCNGQEVASGSIRIHDRELQQKVFKLLNYDEDEAQARFGHLLEAFEYGAPPHGGIAPGIDRLVAILAGEESIREVIAFPKNQSAVDVMTDAPAPVSANQLRDLQLRIVPE